MSWAKEAAGVKPQTHATAVGGWQQGNNQHLLVVCGGVGSVEKEGSGEERTACAVTD